MLAGYGLSAAAKPALLLATTGFGIGAIRTGDRLGKGIRGAPRDALVAAAIAPEDRGRAFGVMRSLDHAGALVGGLVAAGLLAAGLATMRQMFLLAAVPGLASVLVIVLFVREDRREEGAAGRRPFSPRAAWRSTGPAMRRYLVAATLFALANPSDLLLLALSYQRFIDSGVEPRRALGALPLLWAVLHVVRTIGTPLGGRLSDRVGRLPMITAAWVAYAGIYGGAAYLGAGGPAWLAWVLLALYGLHAALAEAPERALVADLQPDPDRRGTAYGMLHFATGLAALPATAAAGVLWQYAGPAWAFGLDATLALGAAGLLWLLLPGRAAS